VLVSANSKATIERWPPERLTDTPPTRSQGIAGSVD
jgi:hypothetical protein